MAHRIRESVRWYGELNLINAAEDEFLGKVHAKRIVRRRNSPPRWPACVVRWPS